MKKQVQILATMLISVVIVSCSKPAIDKPQPAQSATEEISTGKSSSTKANDPLLMNLDGWFEFNGTLKDKLGNLPTGLYTNQGPIYTTDRKGKPKSAIKFDGTYGINLTQVPQQTHGSISVWVKYDDPALSAGRFIVKPKTTGLGVSKVGTEMGGSVETLPVYSQGIRVNLNQNWHHIVVTFDDSYLRLFVDGQFAKLAASSATWTQLLESYYVGYKGNEWFKGSIDDLRFYSRTLYAEDVQKLYNL